jgi:N-hydroxyarylamine O-acetyltransferase
MNVSKYLGRIGYESSCEPGFDVLAKLQLAHLRSVPFENLDIFLGRTISLELEALYEKIVVRRRGGFCYELNGLFAWLLEELGFEVRRLSASDTHLDGSYGPEFDHLTMMVKIPADPVNAWLVDVGWGDTFQEPLRLVTGDSQAQGLRAYRINLENGYFILWQRSYDGHWENQYRFKLKERKLKDFAEMCVYHQTSPESIFTRKRICTLATPEGRISLEDGRLITTVEGVRNELLVENKDAFLDLLKTRFGVEI